MYGLKSHLVGKKQGIGEQIHDREALRGIKFGVDGYERGEMIKEIGA